MNTERAKWYVRFIRLLTHKLLPLSFIGAVGFWLATKIHPLTSGLVGPTHAKLRMGVGITLSLFHRGTVAVTSPNLPMEMRLHLLPGWFIFQLHVVVPNVGNLLTSSDLGKIDGGRFKNDIAGLAIKQCVILLCLTLVISIVLWVAIRWLQQRRLNPARLLVLAPRLLRHSVVGTTIVFVFIASLVALVWGFGSINARASFQNPTVVGDLTMGAQVLNSEFSVACKHLGKLDTTASDELASSISSSAATETSEVRVLHISDVHLNPNGFCLAQRWAKQFHVNFVLDTGDTETLGTVPEVYTVRPMVKAFKLPYVYIRGNHDNPGFEQALRQARNVIDLDHGREVTLDGVSVMGWGDPVLSPNRPETPRQQECRASQMVPAIEKRLAQVGPPPDILAVHDPVMADGVLATRSAPIGSCTYEGKTYQAVNRSQVPGTTPLIIAGHLHRQYVERLHSNPGQPDTMFLHDGTTGADGLGALRPGAHTPYSAEVLTFARRDGQMQLVNFDVIARGHDGEALDRNTTVDDYPVAEPFYQNPPPLAVPPASAATRH